MHSAFIIHVGSEVQAQSPHYVIELQAEEHESNSCMIKGCICQRPQQMLVFACL